jgi:1-acyl-sn-glycerol-3-phosphate acyltransferase
VAIHGSQRARNWKRLQFPKITVLYGEPMRFEPVADPTREQQQAVADEVLAAIKEVYAGLEQHGRRGIVQKLREQRRGGRAATA